MLLRNCTSIEKRKLDLTILNKGKYSFFNLPPKSDWTFDYYSNYNPIVLKCEEGFIALVGDYSSKQHLSSLWEKRKKIKIIKDAIQDFQGCFSAVFYIEKEEKYYFVTDHLSLYPWYFIKTKDSIMVSTRLKLINTFLKCELDPAGFTEFMRHGYTVGKKTILNGVSKLPAGSVLTIDCQKNSIDVKNYQHAIFNNITKNEYINFSKSKYHIDEICELLLNACRVPDGPTLMMSAGWDSRTILAALLHLNTKDIKLYTHGDTKSREALIVKKIADDFKIDCHFAPFDNNTFSLDSIHSLGDEQDNVVFPYWRDAARYSSATGSQYIVSGVLGEVLGGHYGPIFHKKGFKKGISLLAYLMLGKYVNSLSMKDTISMAEIISTLLEKEYRCPWYINDAQWSPLLQNSYRITNSDIKSELENIRDTCQNILENESIYEVFTLLNRGIQYIANQSLTAQHDSRDIVMPFCSKELLKKSILLPFHKKVHNNMNRQIIKRLYPQLLRYPTSAILVKAQRPIILQEGSRALRKLYEKIETRSGIKKGRLGWANFNLVEQQALIDLSISLSLPVFDNELIANFLRRRSAANQHPLWDMILKMKSIDNIKNGKRQ